MIWLFIVCWVGMLTTPAIAIMAIILMDRDVRNFGLLFIKCRLLFHHFHFRYYLYYEEQEYYRDERRNEQE